MLSVQYDSKQNISWTYIINIVLKTIPFKINKYIFPQFYHTGYAEHGKISLWTIYMCRNSNEIYLLVQETNLYWCFSHDLELQRNPQHTHTQLQSYEDWDKRLLFFLLGYFLCSPPWSTCPSPFSNDVFWHSLLWQSWNLKRYFVDGIFISKRKVSRYI